MIKLKLITSFILCFYSAFAQNTNDITIGKIDSIQSHILNEQRKIWISVPKKTTPTNDKKYPVVYLLDGDFFFHSVTGIIQPLSSIYAKILPEMIVVGVPNTNRFRDLSPVKVPKEHPFIDDESSAVSGGGRKTISFIEKELIPYIDANYPSLSYRTFIGHSLGGLLVMDTLLEKPELFNAYVAIDPSVWLNYQRIVKKAKNIKFGERYKNKSLFIGIANTMNNNMDTTSVKKDTTYNTTSINIRSTLKLNSILKNNKQKKLVYKSKYYENDSHGSVPLIATYDAFRFIFNFYDFKLDNNDFISKESEIFNKVLNHYRQISKAYGVEIKPDKDHINGLGYNFMYIKNYKKAKQFFELNVLNYPESADVFDSMGDLYLALDNKEKAIENFKKSIALYKDSVSKAKLEKLLKE